MSSDLVIYEVADRIANITLNRIDKRNALSPALIRELISKLLLAEEDDEVKVIVLRANGTTFSAGADLAYLQELEHHTYEENLADSNLLKKLLTTICYLPKIVIAQVEGHAIAGGCGLATSCDIIFAVPEAKFGYTEVRLGFVPAIVSCFLMRKTSETIAKKLLLSGELFTAGEALAYNLITFVTKGDEIAQKVRSYALQLCDNASSNALMVTKQLINQTTYPWLDKSLDMAVQINARVRESDDFKKGISSFLKKEEIKW